MLVFATSDKGGTGRSVTSSNLIYRRALQGSDVCYLDFDFGSPTAGAIFAVNDVARGAPAGGLHSYLRGKVGGPMRVDVWSESDRLSLRGRPDGAGQLCLIPGDSGGAEFAATGEIIDRCAQLLLRVEEEFDISLVDLSAGRSYATEIVLAALTAPQLRGVTARWLVFHRWTRQHVLAAAGLVYGERGIVDMGARRGHDADRLRAAIRFVRTAVVDPRSEELSGLRATQVGWLQEINRDLQHLAGAERVGQAFTLGSVPLDPVLQWREQLISDADTVTKQIANAATVEAFELIAKLLTEDAAWRSP
ncbi:SCO2523 family variant P-loop protein [Catellatospora coxensis]|uniref:DNA-binding protein n=1 Tax=Catellatospora coxensis TaxID=310354 RepID=A0A8J3KR17_9ACTN|nr:SCO2523 family variant P-loop protein [Catellatospora coxensis]GIG04537.1 DNA-binding protein [Catellatospora coxensis]